MTESMLPNETLQSQLSAFVDGELPTLETELLARRLAREPDLQQTMGRYLLMGEALRAPVQSGVSKDFSAKIAAALEQADGKRQPLTEVAAVHRRSMLQVAPWLKPAAGFAVAASVAVAALLAIRAPQSEHGISVAQKTSQAAPAAQLAAAATNSANSESYVVPGVANVPSAPIPAARLTNYVVAHSEFTSPLGQRNMLMGLLSGDQTNGDAKSEDADGADSGSPAKVKLRASK